MEVWRRKWKILLLKQHSFGSKVWQIPLNSFRFAKFLSKRRKLHPNRHICRFFCHFDTSRVEISQNLSPLITHKTHELVIETRVTFPSDETFLLKIRKKSSSSSYVVFKLNSETFSFFFGISFATQAVGRVMQIP